MAWLKEAVIGSSNLNTNEVHKTQGRSQSQTKDTSRKEKTKVNLKSGSISKDVANLCCDDTSSGIEDYSISLMIMHR